MALLYHKNVKMYRILDKVGRQTIYGPKKNGLGASRGCTFWAPPAKSPANRVWKLLSCCWPSDGCNCCWMWSAFKTENGRCSLGHWLILFSSSLLKSDGTWVEDPVESTLMRFTTGTPPAVDDAPSSVSLNRFANSG